MVELSIFSIKKHVVSSSVGVVSATYWSYCRYRDIPCFRGCKCSIFECCSGNVSVCFLHLNPSGWFQRRKFSEVRS